eukprot:1204854-Pleurochrysis_carterae.AAC.1
MRTCKAIALRYPSFWILARDGPLPCERPLVEPPRRRAPASAPGLAPSLRWFVFYIIPSSSARPDGRSGRSK